MEIPSTNMLAITVVRTKDQLDHWQQGSLTLKAEINWLIGRIVQIPLNMGDPAWSLLMNIREQLDHWQHASHTPED
jgi:hypothetical protein